jgi:biopolymer transport protein ExbB
MKNQNNAFENLSLIFAGITIPATLAVAYAVYSLVLGNPANFEGNDPAGHPINYLGTVYKGGLIVPVLLSCLFMVVIFSIERYLTINLAYGKGKLHRFTKSIKAQIKDGDIVGAIEKSEKQKGALGNVLTEVLVNYFSILTDKKLSKEQKKIAIQQEIEEATALELPVLERNLPVIATLASVSTLIGLLGTVIGMIKAFAALSTAGAPDATALATGISEALINTALGISSSALAIISYNFFTAKIDGLVNKIDEVGFTITQSLTLERGSDKKDKEDVLKEVYS